MLAKALTLVLAQVGASPENAAVSERVRDALDPPARVEIVVDLSGSMGFPVPTTPPVSRLAYVQGALEHYLRALPDRTRVGLWVFGQSSACSPPERLQSAIPLENGGRQVLLGRMRSLQAGGATPLAAALRGLAEHPEPGPFTTLLLSDGLDSCGEAERVCDAARALATRAGGAVRVDVASLFLGTQERAALSCVPQITSGQEIALDQVRQEDMGEALAALQPLRVSVAFLVILAGLGMLVSLGQMVVEPLGKRWSAGTASLAVDLVVLSLGLAWVAFWLTPLLAVPVVHGGLLVVLGMGLGGCRLVKLAFAALNTQQPKRQSSQAGFPGQSAHEPDV